MMWSTEDVRSFYARYAARYDEEIEADPDSYPGPDKVAGWMLSHLELRGYLPPARVHAKRNGSAPPPETAADGSACGRGGVHVDRRERRKRGVAEEDGAADDGASEDGGLGSDADPVLRCQWEEGSGGEREARALPRRTARQGRVAAQVQGDPAPAGRERSENRTDGAVVAEDDARDPSACPRAGLCSSGPKPDASVQKEEGGGASVIEILDLGCGTGRSSRLFFEHPFAAGRLRLTGVDATPEMLEKARLFPFHALHCLNIEQPLGIPPNSFDAVVCVGVMDFVALPKPFLEQVARILRPEGVFGVTLPERRRRAETVGESARDRTEHGSPGSAESDELSSFDWTEADDLVASAGFHIHRRERFLGYVDSETGAETHYYGYLLRLG